MSRTRRHRSGNAVIEFTLVGIPILFTLISTFEIARGMWLYHTLAYSIKEGARYTVVHGNNCGVYPNNCQITIRDIARRIAAAGVGLIPTELRNVVFISVQPGRSVTCATLDECLQPGGTGDTYWPTTAPGVSVGVGGQRGVAVEITAEYPFRSAICMFWPGSRPVGFGEVTFPASSRERIQY